MSSHPKRDEPATFSGSASTGYVRGDRTARDRATRKVRILTGAGVVGATAGTALLTVGLVGGPADLHKADVGRKGPRAGVGGLVWARRRGGQVRWRTCGTPASGPCRPR